MTPRVVHVRDHIDGAVYIGRAVPRLRIPNSDFANPFRIGLDGGRSQVIDKYRAGLLTLLTKSEVIRDLLIQLRDEKALACWCRRDGEERTPANACHGDVLV